MAEIPAGQSCNTCAFFINNSCRNNLPVVSASVARWVPCFPEDWCSRWRVWPGLTQPTGGAAACYYGSDAPSDALGANGDFYVHFTIIGYVTELSILKKTSGSWILQNTIQ